jgi:Kef-type K+ transport system membrane component KefB/nucleotide-binding universal stress UspA family protein
MDPTPVVRLMVQVLAIVLLSRVFSRGLRIIGQPPVIAEITVGILLGPSLLGWAFPAASAWLFPADALPTLAVVSQLGLVFFMFLVGLQFEAELLYGRFRSALAVSNAGMLLPFALGAAIALPLHAHLAPPGTPVTSFALFLGVSMSITAFPVLARILGERHLLRTPVGVMSLASAAIGDVSAWCVLAIVVAIVNAEGLASGLATTALALAYTALMMLAVRPVLARLGPRGATSLSPDVVAGAIALLLLSSTVTEAIGIHALFGGFLLGTVMPRGGGLSLALVDKFEDFVTIVLLPLFFAYSGLRTSVGLLEDASDWLVCGLLVVVAVVGKFGGSTLAARWMGMGWRDATAIGVLMNTRGLMELIVLNIGLDLGVISPQLFTMMVLMALVTTFMTGPLLSLLHTVHAGPPEEVPIGAPVAVADAIPVLVCVSDPAMAPALVTLGGALVSGGRGPLLALQVVTADRDSAVLPGAPPSPQLRAPLDAAEHRAQELGVELRTMSFVSGDVSADIVGVALSRRSSLVLLGIHRPVFLEGSLGGVVGEVIDHSPVPVGVLVDRGLTRVHRVVLVIGHDPQAVAAARVADRLREAGCEIVALEAGPAGAAHDPTIGEACAGADLAVCALTGPASMDPSRPAPCSVLGVSAPI